MMNKFHKTLSLMILASGLSLVTMNLQAKELMIPVQDSRDSIKVLTINTYLARPDKIKISKSKEGLQVAGIIKRKGHKNLRIRGHVDIDLLSANGKKINSQTINLKNKIGPSEHDSQRKFSTSFPLPETDDYRVAIRHHLYQDNH